MVYNPHSRKLVKLNLSAWFIFELCAGHGWQALKREYLSAVAPKIPSTVAERQLAQTLDLLLSEGLIEHAVQ
jgi:hypothetical protein